jgi:hypothetical protein
MNDDELEMYLTDVLGISLGGLRWTTKTLRIVGVPAYI